MPVKLERVGEVALVILDNPPVNAMSAAVRRGLQETTRAAAADPAVKVIALYGEGRMFTGGADIKEFGKRFEPPIFPDLVREIELIGTPTLAVVHGTTLGGGLELALGCHYRVALPGAKVGLPEVNIGVMPGGGGTQRAPRVTSLEVALEMIMTGRHIPIEEALAMGLVDEIAREATPREAALATAERMIREGWPARPTRARPVSRPKDPDLFARTRAELERTRKGEFAVFRCVDAVEAATTLDIEEGLKRERELFLACMDSPQREALIHAFFAEREVAKVPEATAEARPVESMGVVGGGTMGSGIAASALLSGLRVILTERDADAAERARTAVERILDGSVRRGRITEAERSALLGRFETAGTTDALSAADLVVEAAFEDMAVKTEIFRALDRMAKPGAVLATNTSYLDVNEIAAATSRPADVLGLHFFAPAHAMRLLEVVVADETAPEAAATAFAVAKRMGKIAVRSGVCDGFIGNRIFTAYRQAADYIMEDGASPYEIDAAVRDFGFPMGPFEVGDLSGQDISWAQRKRRAPFRPPEERYVEIRDRVCERGWLGRKTGRGFYRYPEGAKTGERDPEVEALVAEERARKRIAPRTFTHEEILRRYMAAMVNEGAKVVDEKIALRPLDVDVVLLHGYGFPRFRGGPMKWADMRGLDRVLQDLRDLEREDPWFWKPSPLIVRLAEEARTFASLNG